MKRLLDADAPGKGKRNSVDVDVTRLLPDHVEEIAKHSIDALLVIAKTQVSWLALMQKNQGQLVVNHKDWHPLMRPVVARAFQNSTVAKGFTEMAEEAEAFGLLSINTEDDADRRQPVPWTIVLRHFIKWNDWFKARPADDKDDEAMWKWVGDFEIVDWRFLDGRWSDRRMSFVTLMLEYAELLVDDDTWVLRAGVENALGLLEIALRKRWEKKNDPDCARYLIEFLVTHTGWVEAFDQESEYYLKGPVKDSLERLLPDFFLDLAACPDHVATCIYHLDPLFQASNFRDWLTLPDIVRYAARKTVKYSGAVCRRLGQAAVAWITMKDLIDNDVLEPSLSDEFINEVCARQLFYGPWAEYWAVLSPILPQSPNLT